MGTWSNTVCFLVLGFGSNLVPLESFSVSLSSDEEAASDEVADDAATSPATPLANTVPAFALGDCLG